MCPAGVESKSWKDIKDEDEHDLKCLIPVDL